MSTCRSTAGTRTCGPNPVKCARLPDRCARRRRAGRSGPPPATSSRAPAGRRANASGNVPASSCGASRPRQGTRGRGRIRRRRRGGSGPGRSRAGSRAPGRPASRRRAAAARPAGSARSPRPCRAAATAPPRRPRHHAARRGRAQRLPHAQMHGSRHRTAVAQRREPGQRQHGHIRAAMHTDQIHPPGARHLPHRQRRPARPQHRYPQAGPDHRAVRPGPGPVRGPGQPRCHHQLAHAQPAQAPRRRAAAPPRRYRTPGLVRPWSLATQRRSAPLGRLQLGIVALALAGTMRCPVMPP